MLSEVTATMTDEQIKEQDEKVAAMTEEELKAFRNSFDPDTMGFNGEESAE